MPSTAVDLSAPPSGAGCAECLPDPAGWWFHLRRCAECGHIGCCDSSPSQHSSRHAAESGHAVIQSFEPGETWFWDFRSQTIVDGPELAPPTSHPVEQPTPGPADRVPADWQSRLH